jgi:hypothetical protein
MRLPNNKPGSFTRYSCYNLLRAYPIVSASHTTPRPTSTHHHVSPKMALVTSLILVREVTVHFLFFCLRDIESEEDCKEARRQLRGTRGCSKCPHAEGLQRNVHVFKATSTRTTSYPQHCCRCCDGVRRCPCATGLSVFQMTWIWRGGGTMLRRKLEVVGCWTRRKISIVGCWTRRKISLVGCWTRRKIQSCWMLD